MKKTQRSQKDERPAKLTAVETFDLKYLMMLNEVALDLIAEEHPQAIKLANAVKAINFAHEARNEIVEASKDKPKQAIKERKIKSVNQQMEREQIYADYLAVKNKRSDWKSSLGIKYDKAPKTIENIVSIMRKAER